MNKPLHILIAAGGTGGHVFPALAIADEVRKLQPDAAILFVGTKKKIEARVVPLRGYDFTTIWISGFHRKIRLENFLFPIKVLTSIVQSTMILRKFRPDAVLGTGGYACGPVLFLASMFGIPTFVHESNSYPGVTTRLVASRVTKVFTAFKATERYLRRHDNIEVVGTPTREVLGTVSHEQGIEFFNLDKNKKTVLVFGGSLGAASINQAMASIAMDVAADGIQFIWQTGSSDRAMAEHMNKQSIGWVNPFIDAMEYAYAAADVVVCRSGATTIAELTRLGKAAILVPYPYAAADHQTLNARMLADAGGAVYLADGELSSKLKQELNSLLTDDVKRLAIAEACRSFGKPNAGKTIAEKMITMISPNV